MSNFSPQRAGGDALCGCVSLFMATEGARCCDQTGHPTFHRTDESPYHSPHLIAVTVVLHWSNMGKKCPEWTYLPLLQMLFHITPLLSSLSWTWGSSGFKVPFILPLRDTQLSILDCPWWLLLGQDWTHGGQVQSFALANSPPAPTSPEVFLPSNIASHT